MFHSENGDTMRIRRALTLGVTLVALTAVTACDNDDADAADAPGEAVVTPDWARPTATEDDTTADGGGNGGVTEQGFDGALPEAADIESLARYVDLYTSCKEVQTGEDYDASHDSMDAAWGEEEAADPAWGIKERAACKDRTYPIALLTVSDMKKFQTMAKASGDKFAIGENIAVVPVGDTQVRALSHSELVFLTCDPDFSPPSGYRTEPALVDGCVLSDYWLD
ncbi:hypothetical protein [Streptomyces sp. A012304]|uniref:hypothetical protein n=1 Tax=Streptomyces sp. A012304 TaxID=375446 RepID=UPI0022310794|nr:hypothetical protein [Streptomyces sp. A012304]